MFNYDNGSAAAAVRPPLLKDVINLLFFPSFFNLFLGSASSNRLSQPGKPDGCFLHSSKCSVFHPIFIHITDLLLIIHVLYYILKYEQPIRADFTGRSKEPPPLSELMLMLILLHVLLIMGHLRYFYYSLSALECS